MYIKIAYGILTVTCPADVLNMCAHIQLCKAKLQLPINTDALFTSTTTLNFKT